jgi:hypothetical protein
VKKAAWISFGVSVAATTGVATARTVTTAASEARIERSP